MREKRINDDKSIKILDFNHQNRYDDEIIKGLLWFIRIHIEGKCQVSRR